MSLRGLNRSAQETGRVLQSDSFKMELFRFFVQEWTRNADISATGNLCICIGLEEKCYCFRAHEGVVIREEMAGLAYHHEEADTKIVLHLAAIVQQSDNHIMSVRSSNTDVCILRLYHASKLSSPATVYMDVGLSNKNTRRYVNISQVANHLDHHIIDALPALHAFTG